MKSDFTLEKAQFDYRNVKDELYLDEKDQFDQTEASLSTDIVKNENDHLYNPDIDWTLMRIQKLDFEAVKFMEQKYYKNSLSGLCGKIFDMDETKIDPE